MNIVDVIHEKARGRQFVLVIMATEREETGQDLRLKVYHMIQEVVAKEFNMVCLRANELFSPGHILLDKLHILIDRAALVVAEISEPRPNVFYEVGYAMGTKKTPLLMLEKGRKAPYDLQGCEVFEYENSYDGFEPFRAKLTESLRVRLKPLLPAFRDMLSATRPSPSYIVASPKYPGKNSRIQGQVFDTRTFGDHLGILGLITAMGAIYGDATGIELISAQHSPPDLMKRDINLYLIGSEKVNKWSGLALKHLQEGQRTRWSFEPRKGWKKGKKGDWPVTLYRLENGRKREVVGNLVRVGKPKGLIWENDYGLLIRGPHPSHPDRMVFVMAGAHSLGTSGACLAATRPGLIKKLQEALPAGTLEDKGRTFWALVKAQSSPQDFLLSEDGVSIEDAGVWA